MRERKPFFNFRVGLATHPLCDKLKYEWKISGNKVHRVFAEQSRTGYCLGTSVAWTCHIQGNLYKTSFPLILRNLASFAALSREPAELARRRTCEMEIVLSFVLKFLVRRVRSLGWFIFVRTWNQLTGLKTNIGKLSIFSSYFKRHVRNFSYICLRFFTFSMCR